METSPKRQLAEFIAKYTPEIGALANASLKKMRAFLPGAVEMVYDNYNALVVGFGPTERASEALFSIALYPKWINLFFLTGAGLKDPKKLLQGSGSTVRRILISKPEDLDVPDVRALMRQALDKSPKAIESSKRGYIVIKSISAKQRPRRP